MPEPRVSVVIAVYNDDRYLAEAIESTLEQRPRPHEVIVVDDGSIDASGAVARRFESPVRCISQSHRGIAAARNTGIAATGGDYVALLDADDLWTARTLSALLGIFAADPGLDLAFGHVRHFISPDVDEAEAARLSCRTGLEPGYLASGVLLRRAALAQVGPFREELVSGEFIDWIARAREQGLREALVPDHVLWRRVHSGNHGIRRRDARGDYARVLKSALDRRRAATGGNSRADSR